MKWVWKQRWEWVKEVVKGWKIRSGISVNYKVDKKSPRRKSVTKNI